MGQACPGASFWACPSSQVVAFFRGGVIPLKCKKKEVACFLPLAREHFLPFTWLSMPKLSSLKVSKQRVLGSTKPTGVSLVVGGNHHGDENETENTHLHTRAILREPSTCALFWLCDTGVDPFQNVEGRPTGGALTHMFAGTSQKLCARICQLFVAEC